MKLQVPPEIKTLEAARTYANELFQGGVISRADLVEMIRIVTPNANSILHYTSEEFQRIGNLLHARYMGYLDREALKARRTDELAGIDGGPRAPTNHILLDGKQREIETLKLQLKGIFDGPDSETIVTVNVLRKWSPEKIRRLGKKLLGNVSNGPDNFEIRLAAAIAEAAKKAHILNDEWESLSGPQLLMLCDDLAAACNDFAAKADAPINLLLFCPNCGLQHVDAPNIEKAWSNPPHRSHECQGCFHTWRPSDHFTNGIQAIDTAGTKDKSAKPRQRNNAGWDK